MFVPPPLLTPHYYFPLELYVYITLTNNNLAFLIYQLIILWTITIKWHRWLLLNNHISNYNTFILVLYRRYINHVSVCPPTFWHLATPLQKAPFFKSFFPPSSPGQNQMPHLFNDFSPRYNRTGFSLNANKNYVQSTYVSACLYMCILVGFNL